MFLTLDSAWKLLAIAFYGLFTFNSVAWAQITPVPGGISLIDNTSSLSSSAGSAVNKLTNSVTGPKILRPALATRSEPELPPQPPAPAYASKPTPSPVSCNPANGCPPKRLNLHSPQLRATNAPANPPAVQPASIQPASVQPVSTQPPSAKPASQPSLLSRHLPSQRQSKLPMTSSCRSWNPTWVVWQVGVQTELPLEVQSRNSSLDPTHGKTFVIQASALGEIAPTPPAPPQPTLPTPVKRPTQTSPHKHHPRKHHPRKHHPAQTSHHTGASRHALPTPKQSDASKAEQELIEPSEFFTENQQHSPEVVTKSESATHLHLSDQPRGQKPPGTANIIAGKSTQAIKNSKSNLLTTLGKQRLESIEFDDVPWPMP